MSESRRLRIVFLYSTVVGHVVGILKALAISKPKPEIDVIFWDKKHVNSSRYVIPEEISGRIKFHARSSFSDKALLSFLQELNPEIVYVSGWMDKGYLKALKSFRRAGGAAKVLCGIDDQWKGSIRQYLGRIYFQRFYRSIFDVMWVSGKPQYHYAERFGYCHENIVSNLLSADTSVFGKQAGLSKRFVFVGRFAPVKGLELLLDAYESLPESVRDEWPLVLIGDGGLRQEVEKRASHRVTVMPFLQPEALMAELQKGGVACVPSTHEPWGVVIHELALLGYPMVLSSACGAATEFLISGYNGFLFRNNDRAALRGALIRIASLSDEELLVYCNNSRTLGERINPEQVAYSLLSVLHPPN